MELTFLERLLKHFNISYEDYLELTKEVSYDDIPSYENFPYIYEAKDLVLNYIKENKKIIIYGDYDADGIMATSILMKAFKKLNYNAAYYIPSRYIDGYGINEIKAQQIVEKEYDLVITVDNGICANEAIKILKDNNIKVIVLDHHEQGEQLPNADYIFHPTINGFGSIASSGAFVTYIFATALLNGHDKYLSTLAAISLITDMMPLVGYNRDFLRVVLQNYKKGEFSNIDYLLENSEFDEVAIGMGIGPKINAIGRVIKNTTINRIVKYFISEDEEEILSYLPAINSTNEIRKEITLEAEGKLLNALKDEQSIHSIVLEVDIPEGLVGLLANKLSNQFQCPCVVFTKSEEQPNVLKGSARAKEGFSLVDAFNSLKEYTLTSGGHALAAGLSIEENNLAIFKEKFEEYAKNNPTEAIEIRYIELNLNEVNKENYFILKSFSPFGEAHKAPELIIRHIRTESLTYSKNNQHILYPFGINQKITYFNVDKEEINKYKYVDMIGTIRISTFRGNTTVDFNVSKFIKSEN